jgi:hypothetical protein
MSRSYKVRIFGYQKIYRSHRTIAHLRGKPLDSFPAAGVWRRLAFLRALEGA